MVEVRTNQLRGDIWAIVSAVTTACGMIAAKFVLREINPISFTLWLFGIGSVIILIDAAINRKVKETLRINRQQLLFLFIVALLFAGATFCFFSALKIAQPGTVSFLSRMEMGMIIILAAFFLKERLRWPELVGLVIVALGIFVMRYGASMELSKAIVFISIEAVLIGTAEVLIKSRINWINHRSFIFYRGLFMVGLFFTVASWNNNLMIPKSFENWLILIVAAIFMPYLGRLGYLKAMKDINISRAAIIVQSQPFFATIAALTILGTFPTFKEILGGLIIVGGVVCIKLLERRSKIIPSG